MRCSACNTENPPRAKFCLECASPLARRCQSCGAVLPDGARFCMECAAPVPGAASAPARQLPTAPERRPQVDADRRDALAGERKQVTVLFADVVGSTALIQDRDEEDAQRLLDGAVRRMVDAVYRFEGTVSRKMGDGLMALFGAPIAHEDHALRACYAALAMLEAAGAYADEVRRSHGAALQIRVGINSGGVIVRDLSDAQYRDYTAMGPTVHLAARMEQLAAPGTALLGPATRALVEGFVEVRSAGPREVKGFDRPIEVHELAGAGQAQTRFQAAAGRGLTPFVGRQEERATIDRALARAREGQGQVVALVAEAGVGKSRLVWEVTQAQDANSLTILQTGALSYGQMTAWLPVSGLLRSYFQLERSDNHESMQERVLDGVRALDQALLPAVPALLALLDVPVEEVGWAALDPSQRRRATLDALRRLLLRLSEAAPLLLIFEDLHWIDAETQALLDSLVEALPTARILLLVNYRPEYTHSWGNRSYYTQLRIEPLGQESADALLDGLLGGAASDGVDNLLKATSTAPLKALLVERTAGNPFFLEESVQALVEAGALTGERGAYRLTRAVEEVRVPATVQAVLSARIDRLPAREKGLLQTAAAIGKNVPFVLFQAVVGLPDDDLQAALSSLQAAELLYATRLYPEAEYTFKHALTHEVAYGSLLQERRKTLHARIVEAIQRLHADRLDEHVEQLANHALRAESWEDAIRYGRRAGDKAAARSAYPEAVAFFEQTLVALEHRAEDREATVQAIDLRLEVQSALFALGQLARIVGHLDLAEAAAERLGDRRRLAAISIARAAYFNNAGDPVEGVRAGQRALAIAEELGDVGLRAAAAKEIGLGYDYYGDFHSSIRVQLEAAAVLVGPQRFERYGLVGLAAPMLLAQAATSLIEVGEFREALAAATEAVEIGTQADHRYTIVAAEMRVGTAYLGRGDLGDAIRTLSAALEHCEAWDIRVYWTAIAGRLSRAYVLNSQIEQGRPYLERAVADSLARGHVVHLANQYTWMAEMHLLAGRPQQANECATRAVEIAVQARHRAREADARAMVGQIAASVDPPDVSQAAASFARALAVAEELGLRPLQAHCHFGLGKLYGRIGRPDEARERLTSAVELFRAMEMRRWLPEAEGELSLLLTPDSSL